MHNAPPSPLSSRNRGRREGFRLLATLAAVASLVIPACGPPPPDEADLAQIERLLKADDHAVALKEAAGLVERFPGSAEACALHGLALLRSAGAAAAEQEIGRCLEIDDGCAEAHLGMGRLAYGRNQLDLALEHYRKAATGGRFTGEALEAAAGVHAERGDFVAALDLAQGAAQRMDYLEGDHLANLTAAIEYYRFLGERKRMVLPPAFETIAIPLLGRGELLGRPVQSFEVRVNGEGPWPFDVDSAARNVMTLSVQLADRLGLERAGRFPAVGVGDAKQTLEGSWVDRIEIGDLSIENVPVLVMDSPTFSGEERGLIGTGLLKRFNCTIDVAGGTFTLYGPDRADLLEDRIDPSRVVARAPLFIGGGPLVLAGVEGGEMRPFLVDTAASVSLIDERYFEDQVESSVDPNALSRVGVLGVGGAAQTTMIPSARLTLGDAEIGEIRLIVYDMEPMQRLVRRYAAGIVGANVLWRHRVHMKFSPPEIVLESYEGPS